MNATPPRTLEHTSLDPRLIRRITLRVAPPLILLYFIAFLDRVNVSFAALTMNRDLGISETLFGLAAGIFFLGYMLFAVPSNLVLVRISARRWIAVLMLIWGVLSGCMAFVHGPTTYIVLRFLVGAAESGFFPGVILYLTTWLPGSARAGIMAMFVFSVPLSNVVGAPISAHLLQMNGMHGLAGWQWLFILEAVPAILVGLCVPFILPPAPQEVTWLSTDEKQTLLATIHHEDAKHTTTSHSKLPIKPIAIACAIYFVYAVGLYEISFWVPKLLKSHGVSLASLGWMTAIPFFIGAIGMFAWSSYSDRIREREWNLTGAFFVGALGMAITAVASTTLIAIAGLSIAAIGIFAALPIFWASFSQRTSAQHAPVGIGAVNSIGNVGGFLGPYATGWLLERTHSYAYGLLATTACLFLGAIIVFLRRMRTA